MATITHVFTNHVAEMLGEDRELIEAIVSNPDNLTYGSIISVVHGDDETITALTVDGIDELRQMLADARRSPEDWNDFLDCFVDDEELTARVKAKSPRNNRPVTIQTTDFLGMVVRMWEILHTDHMGQTPHLLHLEIGAI